MIESPTTRATNGVLLSPSFFCVGAQKSGTTAFHHHLAHHPDIFLPSIKETHFFDDGHGEYRLGMDHYLGTYFRGDAKHAVAGEVDPEYLYFPDAAARIAEHCPNAKLIFILRDPVARAYSHYQGCLSQGCELLDFASAIARETTRMDLFPELMNPDAERVFYQPTGKTEADQRKRFNQAARASFSYVGRGFYFKQVVRYLEFFPQEKMLFLLADDLIHDTAEMLKRVYCFLGVREIPHTQLADWQTNRATLPRSAGFQRLLMDQSQLKPWLKRLLPPGVRLMIRKRLLTLNAKRLKLPAMDAHIEAQLRSVYRADVEQLAVLIGRDLSAWLPKVSAEDGII